MTTTSFFCLYGRMRISENCPHILYVRIMTAGSSRRVLYIRIKGGRNSRHLLYVRIMVAESCRRILYARIMVHRTSRCVFIVSSKAGALFPFIRKRYDARKRLFILKDITIEILLPKLRVVPSYLFVNVDKVKRKKS